MSATVCAFCSHSNPAGSSYCNECGAALKLILCRQCDAINHRSEPTCHKCGADLRSASASGVVSNPAQIDEPRAVAEPTPVTPRSAASTRNAAVVALIVIGLVTAASFAYHTRDAAPPVSSTLPISAAIPEAPPAADVLETNHEADPASKTISATAGDSNVESPNEPVEGPSPMTAPPPAESAAAAKVAPEVPPQRPKDREATARPKSATTPPAVPPLLRPPTQDSTASLRPITSCSDAVAALGLCNRNNREEGK